MKKKEIVSTCILSTILFILIVALIALPDFFFARGLNYFKHGNYQSALKNFSRAQLWNKQNSEYKYYYAQALAKQKLTYNVQKEMFSIANSSNKDGAHIFAAIEINLWRNNIMQRYGNNYIDQTPTNGEIIRWNPKTFPLKVYISNENNENYPDYYNSEVLKAFGQWTASSGFIPFTFINSEKAAQIILRFKKSPTTNCSDNKCKYVIAHTNPVIKKRYLKQMIITIYDRDANGSFFSDKELFSTVLHEIGHALGIMGHSYSTDDLMYMANRTNSKENVLFVKYRSDFQYISPQDINTLKLLYNLAPTISNTSIEDFNIESLIYPPIVLGSSNKMGLQKLKEAKDYIEQAPNLPNGYIDMAIAYDDLGDFDKALDSFQKAFNLAKEDNDKYIILYNIAAMYLNNNKPDSALGYAKQAQAIDNNEDIADLLSNIEHAISTKSKPFWTSKIVK